MEFPKVTLRVELDEEDLFGTLTGTHYDSMNDIPKQHVEPKYLFMIQGNKFEFTIEKYFIGIFLNDIRVAGVYKAEIIQQDVCQTIKNEDLKTVVDIIFAMNDERMSEAYHGKKPGRGMCIGSFNFDDM